MGLSKSIVLSDLPAVETKALDADHRSALVRPLSITSAVRVPPLAMLRKQRVHSPIAHVYRKGTGTSHPRV